MVRDISIILLGLLCQPRNGLDRPNAAWISVLEFLRHLGQNGMVVGRPITRDSSPIHCARRGMALTKTLYDIVVPALCIGIFLVHECHPSEAAFEGGDEIAVGQIAFKAHAFLALTVEEKH